MSANEFAPSFSCCGGMAFHAKRCDAQARPLSPFRFQIRTNPAPIEEGLGRGADGLVFRNVRIRYGLTLREVADGWGVPHVEMGELERGKRRFGRPADMHAALQQLWLWANEKNKEISK